MRLASLAATALLVLGGCAVLRGGGGPPEYRELQVLTTELRELEFGFRRPAFEWIEQDEIPGLLREDLEESLDPEYVAAYEAAFKALGLLPRDLDLIEAMLTLQQDQVVGFYSPTEDAMYVRSDLPPALDEVQAIIVHELVHALQNRHFPKVMDLMRVLRRNDDLVTALAAVVEGDASLTMLGIPDSGLALRRDLQSAYAAREVVLMDLENPRGALGTAPRLLRHSILFPYGHGVVTAARSYQGVGNPGLDALLRDPPLATARVYENSATPAPVEFLALPTEDLAPEGCTLGHDNVAGALTLRVLFKDYLPDTDPAQLDELLIAWSGDRFIHVPCEDGDEFAWVVRFHDPANASAFATLYAQAAAAIADHAGLSGPPAAHANGRTVVVVTEGLADYAARLQEDTEVRAYDHLDAWLEDDCFPESPCPR